MVNAVVEGEALSGVPLPSSVFGGQGRAQRQQLVSPPEGRSGLGGRVPGSPSSPQPGRRSTLARTRIGSVTTSAGFGRGPFSSSTRPLNVAPAAADRARRIGVVGRGVRRSATAKAEDTIRWVAARRSGRTVADIAAGAGVSKATVSRATSPHGPFPSHRNRQEPASCWARAAPARRDCGVDRPRRRGHHGPGCRGDPALWAVPAREVDRPVDGRPLGRGTPPGSGGGDRSPVPGADQPGLRRHPNPRTVPVPASGCRRHGQPTRDLADVRGQPARADPAAAPRHPARPCRSRPARLAVLEHRRHPRLARRLHTAGLPPLPRPGATPRQSPAPEP